MFCRTCLSSAIVAALCLPAAAQEAEPIQLDTLFVKTQRNYDALSTEETRDYAAPAATVGTKLPAALRDIPQSISIVSNQQIKDRNVGTFDQLARKTPGLRVLSNDDGRSSVYARGYEYDEANIDGLPAQMQSINGTLPNLVAFDRVEVMRGPSGLFDSSGEMGGIVNLVRKRPTQSLQASADAAFGTQKTYKLGGDISAPLNADGSLRGRFILETAGKSPEPARQNNHHETAYAAFDWDISAATTLGLGYLYQQRDITPDNGLAAYSDGGLLSLPQKKVFMGAPWNHFDMHSHDLFLDVRHYFANGAFGKLGLRYSDRDAASNYAFGGGKGISRKDHTTTASGLATRIEQSAFAADASYSQPFNWGDTDNEFVVGADYNHFATRNEQGRSASLGGKLDYRRFAGLPYADIMSQARSGARGYRHSINENTLDEFGAYGKIVVRPVDSLSLIGGGRIGHYQLESGAGKQQHRKNGTFFTGYAGVVWDFTATDSLYASYSSLYRPQTALGIDGNLLKPRQGQQYEIGHKGSYLDDKLHTRVSLYRLQDKNAAASLADNNARFAALGERVMQGVEAEISGEINPRWRIHAGYSYLDSNIKTASTTRDDGIFLLMPRHTFNLWSTYDIHDNLTVGGGINTMSGIASSQGIRTGGHTTVDLMASYRINPSWQLQLNVDNLFNRRYYTRVGALNTFNIPGAERSITAKLRYDFK